MKLAIFFLGTTPAIDLAGAELLVELHRTLDEQGIAFQLAEARGGVRDTLYRAGYVEHGGTVAANQTVATIVRATRRAD